MDPEKTRPFELGEGDDACLVVHGFTGSPWDVRPLGEALAARGYRVKGVRLPGHGSTPEAMLGVGYRDWEQTCEDALDSLSGHRHVFVAGLSMGALLSILLAARRPDRVHGLALIAPAIEFRGATMRLLYAVRNLPLLDVARPWIDKESTDISDPAVRAEAPVLHRFPSARIHDLYEVRDRARAALGAVTAPALIVCARNDHVVTLEGGKALARGLRSSPAVRFITLEQGFHIVPRDLGKELLFSEVGAFFDRLRDRPG
jgi:carboxylesterase